MSTLCTVCLGRNTEPDAHTDAVRAALVRWLLTRDDQLDLASKPDATLLKTQDSVLQEADNLLSMLAYISKPAPENPPF